MLERGMWREWRRSRAVQTGNGAEVLVVGRERRGWCDGKKEMVVELEEED